MDMVKWIKGHPKFATEEEIDLDDLFTEMNVTWRTDGDTTRYDQFHAAMASLMRPPLVNACMEEMLMSVSYEIKRHLYIVRLSKESVSGVDEKYTPEMLPIPTDPGLTFSHWMGQDPILLPIPNKMDWSTVMQIANRTKSLDFSEPAPEPTPPGKWRQAGGSTNWEDHEDQFYSGGPIELTFYRSLRAQKLTSELWSKSDKEDPFEGLRQARMEDQAKTTPEQWEIEQHSQGCRKSAPDFTSARSYEQFQRFYKNNAAAQWLVARSIHPLIEGCYAARKRTASEGQLPFGDPNSFWKCGTCHSISNFETGKCGNSKCTVWLMRNKYKQMEDFIRNGHQMAKAHDKPGPPDYLAPGSLNQDVDRRGGKAVYDSWNKWNNSNQGSTVVMDPLSKAERKLTNKTWYNCVSGEYCHTGQGSKSPTDERCPYLTGSIVPGYCCIDCINSQGKKHGGRCSQTWTSEAGECATHQCKLQANGKRDHCCQSCALGKGKHDPNCFGIPWEQSKHKRSADKKRDASPEPPKWNPPYKRQKR